MRWWSGPAPSNFLKLRSLSIIGEAQFGPLEAVQMELINSFGGLKRLAVANDSLWDALFGFVASSALSALKLPSTTLSRRFSEYSVEPWLPNDHEYVPWCDVWSQLEELSLQSSSSSSRRLLLYDSQLAVFPPTITRLNIESPVKASDIGFYFPKLIELKLPSSSLSKVEILCLPSCLTSYNFDSTDRRRYSPF